MSAPIPAQCPRILKGREEAAMDNFYGFRGGVDLVGGIEFIVAQLVNQDFVGGKIVGALE